MAQKTKARISALLNLADRHEGARARVFGLDLEPNNRGGKVGFQLSVERKSCFLSAQGSQTPRRIRKPVHEPGHGMARDIQAAQALYIVQLVKPESRRPTGDHRSDHSSSTTWEV